RRAAAIETLGSATVLCTDKTGTLTENRMRIAELRLKTGEPLVIASAAPDKFPKAFAELAAFGLLASAPEPFDPMDKAFHELGKSRSKDLKQRPEAELALIRTYGLRPNLLAITHAWRAGDGKFTVAAKGAPEAIAGLCRLSAKDRAAVTRSAEAMAAEGLRVLGVARATFTGKALPKTPRDFDFAFAGLVGLADPLRASVPEAIRQCQSAGIRVVMITGDYPATARAIALQAGLAVDRVVTGEEVEGLSDGDLAQAVRAATIFARIMPQQKLRIVSALKANGEIVAMTGDGVNDAPSLKAAHIGIAMGGRGTDVAREASSIVLLDDDFGSIVKAILLGRRIYDNLRKAMGFVLSVHVPIAGLALIPLLFGLPIILWPMHIAFLEMVIDPVCTLVFEAETEEKDVMRKPPRKPEEPLFSWSLIGWSFLQGTLALAIVATIFVVAHQSGMPEAEVRALAFFSLVLSIVSLIFVDRSYSSSLLEAFTRPNAALALVLIMVCATLGLTQLWPFAGELFRFDPLQAGGLALVLAAATALLLLLEMLKPLWRRHMPR
ncbi:MAG: cation-translocating P-type ATPase, partial [Rhizobiales bacterium]|nr:cation-translocating P-type ATPase [Hyphomicrobiales bacterium]